MRPCLDRWVPQVSGRHLAVRHTDRAAPPALVAPVGRMDRPRQAEVGEAEQPEAMRSMGPVVVAAMTQVPGSFAGPAAALVTRAGVVADSDP
jgi:hypothetical protein